MSLRLGEVLYPSQGLRLGSVQYSGVVEYAPTTWGGERVTWDGEDVYWFADTTTPPVLALARILGDGIDLRLSFSKKVRFGVGGNGGFALTASGGAVTATYQSGAGSSQLLYSLSRAVLSTETVTLAYTQPTDGVEDVVGNDLESFTGFAVTFPIGTGIISPIVQRAINSVVSELSTDAE